ncbi:hypothetical protein WKH31_10995 [Metabacillus indicus]|uniref:hypothetical protein n=1 Tax=Metabacillus indicus TaxID=246786 RepID=UPI00317B7493
MKIDNQKIQLINASYFIEEQLRQGQFFILCARAEDERLIINSNEFNLFKPLATYSFKRPNKHALIDRKLNHLKTILLERKDVHFILCLYGKQLNQHLIKTHRAIDKTVKQWTNFFAKQETHSKKASLFMEKQIGSLSSLYIYANSLKEILEVFHEMNEFLMLDSPKSNTN